MLATESATRMKENRLVTVVTVTRGYLAARKPKLLHEHDALRFCMAMLDMGCYVELRESSWSDWIYASAFRREWPRFKVRFAAHFAWRRCQDPCNCFVGPGGVAVDQAIRDAIAALGNRT
jgi:hypothetical protein